MICRGVRFVNRRLVLSVLVVWLLVLLYVSTFLFHAGDVVPGDGAHGGASPSGAGRTEPEVGASLQRQLDEAMRELDAVKRQNRELQRMALEIREARHVVAQEMRVGGPKEVTALRERLEKALKELEKTSLSSTFGGGRAGPPSTTHELARFAVERGVREAARFFVGQLKLLRRKMTPPTSPPGTGPQDGGPGSNRDAAALEPSNDDEESMAEGRFRRPSRHIADPPSAETILREAGARVDALVEGGTEHLRTLMADLEEFRDLDGLDAWRRREVGELSATVQAQIEHLQNPKRCLQAKKLVCNLNKGCGYGCQLHHVVYCLVLALSSKRTLVLESTGWRYHPDGGWEAVFQPISKTCVITNAAIAALERRRNETDVGLRGGGEEKRRGSFASRPRKKRPRVNIPWGAPSLHPDALEVEIPIVDSLNPRPPQLPLAVPADLRHRLEAVHRNPPVWWIGQLLKYLLKPKPALAKLLQETESRLDASRPVVGVHVRRTDKVGTEAAFHPLSEYMARVDEWFDTYEIKHPRPPGRKRTVFLATDEPAVLEEAVNLYSSNYDFISDNNISKSAGLSSRYSEASLQGIILDIHSLAHSDFIVCTFSSQVCRVAYELMQSLHADASERFASLDDVFYFGGQNPHNVRAVRSHVPRGEDEIPLEVGDLVGIAGNHWDGFSKGVNRRLNRNGLFPSFKVEDHVEWVAFPTIEEFNNSALSP